MIRKVKEFSQLPDHVGKDSLAVVVMSHGNAHGFAAKDSKLKNPRDRVRSWKHILEPFTGQNCPNMAGKPKIFFLTCCRPQPG